MNRQFMAARRTLNTWKAAQEHSEQENAKFNLHQDAISTATLAEGRKFAHAASWRGVGKQAHSYRLLSECEFCKFVNLSGGQFVNISQNYKGSIWPRNSTFSDLSEKCSLTGVK